MWRLVEGTGGQGEGNRDKTALREVYGIVCLRETCQEGGHSRVPGPLKEACGALKGSSRV